MAANPPIKPPRGVKYGKETSGCGLLVTVIKTLDASETNEERQKEKQKIEREYKKTDQKLNELVSKHDGDLTKVMHLFGLVSADVTSSREKIHTVKENLQACKQLLNCRREELQKLWMDAVQQKYVLEMLEQITELRKVPSIVTAFIAKKHYLHATKALTKAIELSTGQLRDVEGLDVFRHDLLAKQSQLYSRMIDELNKHLYQTSTGDILMSFHRQGSTNTSNYSTPQFQRTFVRRSIERTEANTKVRKALFEMTQGFDVDKTDIIGDPDALDPDLNASYFIGIIVESLALLHKVPESVEAIKIQIQPELLGIVTKTTQHMLSLDHAITEGEIIHNSVQELTNLVFKQFKAVANTHKMLLKNYLAAAQRHSIPTKLYDISDFWVQAQAVLQLILTDYLDIQNSPSDEQPITSYIEPANNINIFFNRRKTQAKRTLFRFDRSAHIEHDVVKEHRRNASDVSNEENLMLMRSPSASDKKKRDKLLICKPDAALIRQLYLPLMGYVSEIEEITKCKGGQLCTLNEFISNYVKHSYLAKGHNRNLQMTIESLSKSHDAWRAVISPEEMKIMGLNRPLLQSTVFVENRITETKELIHDLPNYSDDLLKMVCSLLKTYRETCQAAYRGIVQPETEDKRIYSVAWLKDEDISRFLKTLPNWTDLKTSSQKSKLNPRKTLKHEMFTSEEESPTQIQQRNIREAEMLTSNLGEGGISHQEILSDIGVLKELAILQESMEWFSSRISEFANELRKPIPTVATAFSGGDSPPTQTIKDGTIKVLTNLALEFDDLANTCLLVLHLEVRVQCFHYLRTNPADKNKLNTNKDSLEPDIKVLKLTKVLSEMDEALNATLHPRKTKYIFEGLAHLAARILIQASNSMETVDQTSVQRICRNAIALQQTLSSITASREVALDQAKMFYEMLYMDPEEILTTIIERGPQFTEMQYLNALQLACKCKGIVDINTVIGYQENLSGILGAKGALGAQL